MKISSKVEICNLALGRLNQNSIDNFETDMSVQGQFCRLSYEQAKSALLSQYNWVFAIKSSELNILEIYQPIEEYKYVHSLPIGFLRLVGVYTHDNDEVFSITGNKAPYLLEGNTLKCDIPNVKIKYIADIDNVSEFSPLFIDCLILDLAVRLTKLFNNSSTYLQQLLAEYQIQLERAKRSDCQQTNLSQVKSYPILFSTWGF